MRTPPGRFGRLRDRARVRRDGKRDGQLGIPTTNEVTHPPALMAIAQRADEAVADLVRWWAGEDARLRERSGAEHVRPAHLRGRHPRGQRRRDRCAATSARAGCAPRRRV